MTIPSIELDPSNDDELLQRMQDAITTASGGVLNDFRASSPVMAILEGQVFGISELLFYLNLLPAATALEVFRLAGFERSLGTPAIGQVLFTLTAPLGTDFNIHTGYQIRFLETYFSTTEDLIIPAGNVSGLVSVQCDTVGSAYNVPEYGINVVPELNFVQSITNPNPIIGGSDLEELDDTLDRLQTTVRNKDVLITATDYALAVQAQLGAGSYAEVFPLLTEDKTSEETGHVHVFCFDPDNEPSDQTTLDAIKLQLADTILAGTNLWLSPGEIIETTLQIYATSENISSTMAENIKTAVDEYLLPANYGLGKTFMINEIVWLTRSVEDVTGVTSVSIDNKYENLAMTQQYMKPVITQLDITLTNSVGNVTQYIYVNGIGTGAF